MSDDRIPAAVDARPAAASPLRWLTAALDEVDYGLLVVDDVGRVLYANRAAAGELTSERPLQLLDQELRARDTRDAAALRAALIDARRGLRKLLTLGTGNNTLALSVVPLAPLGNDGGRATLVMLGRRAVVGELAVHGYARGHGLTAGETRVLTALCSGAGPTQIAVKHAVAISTVRTQIGAIRAKTGAASIRDLVQHAATLPPLMTVLRDGMAARAVPAAALAA